MNNLKPEFKEEKPWWNRPLTGESSLIELLINLFNKKTIPDVAICLHDEELEELSIISPTIQMQDSDRYTQEFFEYIDITHKINNNEDDYKGLNTFINILIYAIDRHNHFSNLQKIELDYSFRSFLELSQFVDDQLNNNLDQLIFKQEITEKTENLLSKTDNKLEQEILRSYLNSLQVICEDQIGLNLLSILHKYNIADYKIFKNIAGIIKDIKKQDLSNLKALVLVVKLNYEYLEQLGNLIGIPKKSNEPITYAKILQYIALCQKYHTLDYRFNQLLTNLKKWEKHYQTVKEIRTKYLNNKYQLPESFTNSIPGEKIYDKYKDHFLLK